MKLNESLTDQAILTEMGVRLARLRIDRGLTQAQLAEAAGVGKRTVERMEAGHSVQLDTLVRLSRVLDLMEGLDRLLPEPGPGPMALLRNKDRRKERQRAAGRRAARGRKENDGKAGEKRWSWGDETRDDEP